MEQPCNLVSSWANRDIFCPRHNFGIGSTKSDTCSVSKFDDSTGDQAQLQRAQLAYYGQMEDKEKTRNKQVRYLTFEMEKNTTLLEIKNELYLPEEVGR